MKTPIFQTITGPDLLTEIATSIYSAIEKHSPVKNAVRINHEKTYQGLAYKKLGLCPVVPFVFIRLESGGFIQIFIKDNKINLLAGK